MRQVLPLGEESGQPTHTGDSAPRPQVWVVVD